MDQLLALLAELRVPALPEPAFGLDGVTYSLTVNRGMNRVCWIWWGWIPTEWEPVIRRLERL